jgi:hypothetical protein
MISRKELIAHWGVSKEYVSRMVKKGCPLTSLADADAYRAEHQKRTVRQTPKNVDNLLTAEALAGVSVENECILDTLDRLRKMEKVLAGAYEASINSGKYADIVSLEPRYATVVDLLSKLEARVVNLEVARGQLVSVDAAKRLVSDGLAAVIAYLRTLPDRAQDDIEKARLTAFSDEGLRVIRES